MEMPNDINTFDSEDIGLKGIFGDRFHDETTANPEAAKNTRNGAQTPEFRRATQPPAIGTKTEPNTIKEAQWNPPKPDPNWFDRLKACVKWTAVFGGLCMLFFYWQQTGQMEASAAVPSMCACCALAGASIGKNTIKGDC